jgi:hypothetical protein
MNGRMKRDGKKKQVMKGYGMEEENVMKEKQNIERNLAQKEK